MPQKRAPLTKKPNILFQDKPETPLKKLLALEEDNQRLKQDLVHASIALQHANTDSDKKRLEQTEAMESVQKELEALKGDIKEKQEECKKLLKAAEIEKGKNEDLEKILEAKVEEKAKVLGEMEANIVAVNREKRELEQKIKVNQLIVHL